MSNFASKIVVWDIEVGGNHDVSVSSIGESVTIGLVQVAGSCRIGGAVIRKVSKVAWLARSCGPARFQSCSSRVGCITVNWVAVNSITNLSFGRRCGGTCDACSRNLKQFDLFTLPDFYKSTFFYRMGIVNQQI